MKNSLFATVSALAAAMLAVGSSAPPIRSSTRTIINTISAWENSTFPNQTVGWDKTGQSFKVPASDTVLSTWTVGVRSALGTQYRLRVYAWDVGGNHPIGPALFDSGSLPANSTLRFVQHQVGLELEAGGSYTTVVEWDPSAPPNTQGNVAYFSSASSQGGYPDGHLSNAIHFLPSTTPWDFDASWDLETGFSATFVPASPWLDLGQALAGTGGAPQLTGEGTLQVGSPTVLTLQGALPGALSFLVVGSTTLELPFKGGVLVPAPDVLLALPVDGTGQVQLAFPWPPGLPPGTTLSSQFWIQDPGGPFGYAASNGLAGTAP